jgi:hypothetical protein
MDIERLFLQCVQVDDDVILNFQQKIFDIHDRHVHLTKKNGINKLRF